MELKKRKTDREKRAELDMRLQKEYPNETPTQIRQRREVYLREKYGTGVVMVKPQPEKRQCAPQMLTLERIVEESVHNRSFFTGPLLVLLVVLPAPGLISIMALYTRSFAHWAVWFCFALTAFLLFCGIKGLITDRREKRELMEYLLAGNFRMVRYSVADMDLEDIGGDDSRIEYRLHLIGKTTTSPWICECTKLQYETTREGDTVYMVYPGKSKRHCYLFSDAGWTPSAEVHAIMMDAVDA